MSDKVLNQASGENWTCINGDCVDALATMPENSIGYSIYSVPFLALYVFSSSERDFSNCKTKEEFFEQMRFMARHLLRATKPGRLTSIHCVNLSKTINTHGRIGIYDFRGDLIRLFEEEGWIYHAEVCIWKDPVMAMHRTKSIGLLHKQVVKDSALSRQGLPDYLVTLRKAGTNAEPIHGEFTEYIGEESGESFEAKYRKAWHERAAGDASEFRKFASAKSIQIWQRYASPVWMDINQTESIQNRGAVPYRACAGEDDEKHICPLQPQVIQRGIELWSNEGDIVLTPFMGIGSECYVALEMGRRAIGIELKKEYYDQAVENCHIAERKLKEKLLL